MYICVFSPVSTRYVFFLRPCRAILVPTHTISLPDDSDPAQHKRVINYLRVGHVFPSCSLSSFRSFLPPLLFRLLLLLPTMSPAAFHLAPLTLRVCTHSLMLIRLNAQKPSRGRSKRLALPCLTEKLRAITKRVPTTTGVVTDDLVENNRDVRPLVCYVTGEKIRDET